MGGGNPLETHAESSEFDWMEYEEVHGSQSPTDFSDPVIKELPVMQHPMQQQTREVWMEYVQVTPSSSTIKSPSTPALVLDGQVNQLAVSGLPNKASPAALQYDGTHNLARQAEQSTSTLASMFDSSNNRVHTKPNYFSSPSKHHSIPSAPLPAAFSPVVIQLMDIVSDKQDLSFVEKVRVLEAQILKLCNIVASDSARGKGSVITSIDFDALNLQQTTVLGFYGDKSILTKIFKEKKLAPSSLVDIMHANGLKSGLYACLNGDGKLYLFYWDARDQFVEASRKDVSCNFVRYLIELCESVFVCVEGQAMEEGMIKGVNSLPTQQQRTQRLQVSMRKESENDLKLHKGFDIQLKTLHQYPSYLMVGLPQGLHRCLILSGALNTPKLVSVREQKTDTPAKLRAWIASKAADFSLDCCQLKDDEFLLLLNVLDKQDQLEKYSKAEETWKNKQLEADKKMQLLDSNMKTKKTDLLSIFRGAMQCMLLQKHPWEESLLQNLDSSPTKFQPLKEVTKHDASSESSSYGCLQEYEGKLCSWWSERDDPEQRFLFVGSIVEILPVDMGGQVRAPGHVFSIAMVNTPNCKMVDIGPISFGQHFKLTGKLMEFDANCTQECIAYFSKADGVPFGKKEPVILNGDTKFILNLIAVSKSQGDLVVVRHAGSGNLGIITWLTEFCNGHMSLQVSAASISHLFSKIDSKSLDDKLFEKLLKEPLKKWPEMKCLSPEASSIIMEFLSERPEEAVSIPEQITNICSKIYREARQKAYMAAEAFVTKEFCPAMREKQLKQLQQQKESMKEAHSIEAKALLSSMKAELFTPLEICSEKSEQKLRNLKLLNIRLQSRWLESFLRSKVTVSYTYEEPEKETLTWRATEMVSEKSDLDELLTSPSPYSMWAVVPVCGRLTELITLNSQLERLSGITILSLVGPKRVQIQSRLSEEGLISGHSMRHPDS